MFCFVFIIRPEPYHPHAPSDEGSTLSLKPSQPNSAPWPSTHAWPMQRQTRKASECGACFSVRHRQSPSTLTFVSAFTPLLPHPHPHPTPPRQFQTPKRRGRGETMGPPGGIQNLPSQKTNINNTNLRAADSPSLVRDAIPRPPGRGRAGRAGDAKRYGRRSRTSFVPEAPEVLTHWLRLRAAARRMPAWLGGKTRAPQPH